MSETAQNANSESQEVSHEITLYAEPIAQIGEFTITNSLITSWIAVIILAIFFVAVGKKIKSVPRGIHNIFELILEGALNLADSVTGDRKKTEKFLPITLSLFLFILVSNWLGLFPGMGTIGFIESHEGESVFVPLFRASTADLNTTLAFSIMAIALSHIFAVTVIGGRKHFNKFINLNAAKSIFTEFKNDKTVIIVNPIKIFVGLLEIIGEIAKIASLSFRLFGNVFAGEVLIASMMAIIALVLPIPFIFMEMIVGLIQALIFAMLSLVFMTIATQDHAEEH
jgi:F-type H+-transporting ATPase subunit a